MQVQGSICNFKKLQGPMCNFGKLWGFNAVQGLHANARCKCNAKEGKTWYLVVSRCRQDLYAIFKTCWPLLQYNMV